MRSAPQKQPRPTWTVSTPSGNGGTSGVPSTVWRSGTAIGVSRPGSASAAEGISDFLENSIVPLWSHVPAERYTPPHHGRSVTGRW